jgi:hypothetical protein
MSGYAQMMMKKGAMTKKGKKETPTHSLERELLIDHGSQSSGVPSTVAAGVLAVTSLDAQAVKKRKLVLRARQSTLTLRTRSPSRMMMRRWLLAWP